MTLLLVGFPIFVDVLKCSLYFSSFKLITYRLFLLSIVVYLNNYRPLEYSHTLRNICKHVLVPLDYI